MSKYMLNGIGMIGATSCLISSMTTNEPSSLPKRRVHNDNGLIKISRILIGAIIATGSAKLFTHPLSHFLWKPAYSINTMLIRASAAVAFKSLVGGLKPINPIRFATPMYSYS